MTVPPGGVLLRRLVWSLLVVIAALGVYIGLGAAVLAVIGHPITATLIVDAIAVATVALARWRRPVWFTYPPAPGPESCRKATGRLVIIVTGSTLLAFAAGQLLSLQLYAGLGSPGFDATTQLRHAAGALPVAVLNLVAAPAGEEALFRGLIYPLLRRRIGLLTATGVTAVAFGLLHANIVQFAAALPLAVVVCLLYERTRRVWPGALVHLAFNAAAIVVPVQVMTTVAGPITTLLVSAAFVVAALVLYRQVRTGGDAGRDEPGLVS